MSLLKKTKTYLIGPMEFQNGEDWREKFTKDVKSMGIHCFNPYKKEFIHRIDESDAHRKELNWLREHGEYDALAAHCKDFRIFDLACVDKSDFIVCYVDTSVFSVGTFEELSWANRLKKPIFVVVKQGKKSCPLWIFGMIDHNYIFDTFDEVVDKLKRINNEEEPVDHKRWRLLQEGIR